MSIWFAIVYIVSTMIVALVSPFWGFLGLVCSILIRFQDRFETISQHPTFLYMSLACVVGFIIHKDKLGKADFWPDKHWLRFLGWIFVGLLIMAPGSMIDELKFVISSMVLYFFGSRCLTTEKRFLIFFAAVVSISVGMGYESITSFLNDPDSPFAYINGEERRMIGWGRYGNANEFGALMVMPIGLVFCLILLSRSILFKLLYISAGALLLYATALTFSRTCMAIVGIMAMTIAALWGKGNVVKRAITLGLVGLTLTTALTVIPGPLQSRFMTILNFQQDASFLGRQRAWDQGFHMVRHQPILGVGMGQWSAYHAKAPHNSFVQAMAETGYPGIFFYLSALFFAFKINLRIIEVPASDPRYNPRTRILAICVTSTLVGYIVYAFFGNQAYTPFMYIYSGICAGLANLMPVNQETAHTSTPSPATKNSRKNRKKSDSTETNPADQLVLNLNGPASTTKKTKFNAKTSSKTTVQIEKTNEVTPKKPRFPQAPT